MFSKRSTTKSTGDYWEQIDRLKEAFKSADAVVIGAGAGLSTSAGFQYAGERFRKYFSDFEEKYGFHDMYSGGFCRYDTPEEQWAYWSRFVTVNRYMDAPKPTYELLFKLVENKDYFVITTNVDHCFQKAGFDKKRLFYTQGDYGLFQCSEPCCQETFDNEDMIRRMMEQQTDMRIPSELLPVCPHCGKPMMMNLRSDDRFVEDEGWHRAAERYEDFLSTRKKGKMFFLELGVGYNTPGIIKFAFYRLTKDNRLSTYACINYGEAYAPEEIAGRSIVINGDVGEVIKMLLDQAKK